MKKLKLTITALFITAGTTFLSGCSTKTINTDELIKVTEQGASGYGSVDVRLSEEGINKLKETYISKIENISDPKQISKALEQENLVLNFLDSVKLEEDGKDGSLKNGDKVNIRIHYNPEILKKLGAKLSKSTTDYKMKSLKEPTDFDPFNEMKVIFSGVSGNGTAQISDLTHPVYVKYTLDKDKGLKNGDTVKVKAVLDDNTAKTQGYIVKNNEKDLKVEGLTEPQTVNVFDGVKISFKGELFTL